MVFDNMIALHFLEVLHFTVGHFLLQRMDLDLLDGVLLPVVLLDRSPHASKSSFSKNFLEIVV